jgi:hypothetical protein
MALRPRWLKRAMRNTLPSMIPHAKLQPSAPRSIVRTWIVSAVTTPSVKVKVSAIIKPNITSEILSIGSRIRSADLVENCANGSTAIRAARFPQAWCRPFIRVAMSGKRNDALHASQKREKQRAPTAPARHEGHASLASRLGPTCLDRVLMARGGWKQYMDEKYGKLPEDRK